MFNNCKNRLLLALILVISHLALTVHASVNHNDSELTQCEICVVQGSTDAAIDAGEWYSADSEQPGPVTVSVSETLRTTVLHPAWSQRAPPRL